MTFKQKLNFEPDERKVAFSARLVLPISALSIIIQLVVLPPNAKMICAMTTTSQPSAHEFNAQQEQQTMSRIHDTQWQQQKEAKNQEDSNQGAIDKRAFVVELLRMLYEQYGGGQGPKKQAGDVLEERRSQIPGQLSAGPRMMHQLLEAIGAEGDMRRLIDWVRNSFSPAAIPEVTTQFVVSKLGSVNCPAILQPDREDTLIPRFLLFNEHFVDVPFELSINPNRNECLKNGKFDPKRKTIVLVHGYLTGYTLVDGITNIKNRLLDLNQALRDKAINSFSQTSDAHHLNGSSFVYTEDLNAKLNQQMHNVIIVDWFNGANPTPRANYIRSAVNAQVVGRLIARFLSALVVQCRTPAINIQIIAHSLGCHVSGFTGKAMNAAGHRLGRITHLDPVGLCFGRLFSQPRFRLSPDDALDTQAVHTSLNLFDNPLDGTHVNFLVNGGRDQAGCGGPSELTNSTTSSISLLFDPAAKFGACSHMRALNLFEEDHSSEPEQCQLVGYRCQNYDRFLAGKCGFCDASNSQCRLMSMQPFSTQFRHMSLARPATSMYSDSHYYDLYASSSIFNQTTPSSRPNNNNNNNNNETTHNTMPATKQSATSWTVTGAEPSAASDQAAQQSQPSDKMFGAPSYILNVNGNELAARRSDRRLSLDKRDRIVQALEKLRTETRTALVSGLSNFRPMSTSDLNDNFQGKDKAGNEDLEHGCDSELSSVAVLDTSTMATTTSLPPTARLPLRGQAGPRSAAAAAGVPMLEKTNTLEESPSRTAIDPLDNMPVGGQKIPTGSLNGPLYFLGTSAVSTYCLNYYQFRVLVAESRLQRIIQNNGLGSNRLAPQLSQHRGGIITAAATLQERVANANGRDMLHLTVKLTDTKGRFFKGFSLLEHARSLGRVANEFTGPSSPLPVSMFGGGPAIGLNEPMVELTMLLNSTRPEPQKVAEAIISYYFHQIVLADRVEINYMSNVSPEIRARYSSVLCPVAINDRHQLVKYIECQKVTAVK